MKQINNIEMKELFKNEILFNTSKGIVDQNGYPSGYMTTKNKAYIEDKFADIAKELVAKAVVS